MLDDHFRHLALVDHSSNWRLKALRLREQKARDERVSELVRMGAGSAPRWTAHIGPADDEEMKDRTLRVVARAVRNSRES